MLKKELNERVAVSTEQLRAFPFEKIIEEVQQAKSPGVSYQIIIDKKIAVITSRIYPSQTEQQSSSVAETQSSAVVDDTTTILKNHSVSIKNHSETQNTLATIASRHDETLERHEKYFEQLHQKNQQQDNIHELLVDKLTKIDEKHTASHAELKGTTAKLTERVNQLEVMMTPRRRALDNIWEEQLSAPTPQGTPGIPSRYRSIHHEGFRRRLSWDYDDDDDDEGVAMYHGSKTSTPAGLKTTGLPEEDIASFGSENSAAHGLKTTGLEDPLPQAASLMASAARGLNTTGSDNPSAAGPGPKTRTAGSKTTGLDPSTMSGSKQKQSPPASVSGTTNNTTESKQPEKTEWEIWAKKEQKRAEEMLSDTEEKMYEDNLPTVTKSSPARSMQSAGLPYSKDDYAAEGGGGMQKKKLKFDPTAPKGTSDDTASEAPKESSSPDDGEDEETSASNAKKPKKSSSYFARMLGFD
mmetsp:Transcript_42057/g.101128  ORF Transcript_42057/g.101128 Transcript_42057/m.101128 type:complete len:468 (-) Transcript_42057:244-1647(-)